MSNNCKDCKHWTRKTDLSSRFGGDCVNPEFVRKEDDSRSRRTGHHGNYPDGVRTGPLFGCEHFEAR